MTLPQEFADSGFGVPLDGRDLGVGIDDHAITGHVVEASPGPDSRCTVESQPPLFRFDRRIGPPAVDLLIGERCQEPWNAAAAGVRVS